MTLKANGVMWLRRAVLPQGSQGPDGEGPPASPYRPELRAATACSNFLDSKRPRLPDRGAPSRGGRSHPPACAPCQPLHPPRAGALRGGVMAPPVGFAPRRRAAAAAVAAAAPPS